MAATPISSVTKPVSASNIPTKPTEEDRIEPNKTAYTPVNLPAPKKLRNPFEKFEQAAVPPQSAAGGPKKLTWSERQALAKKQQEEDAKSRATGFNVQDAPTPISKPVFKSNAPAFGRATAPTAPPRNFGAVGMAAAAGVGVAAGVGAVAAASSFAQEPEPEVEAEVCVCRMYQFVYTSYGRYFRPRPRLQLPLKRKITKRKRPFRRLPLHRLPLLQRPPHHLYMLRKNLRRLSRRLRRHHHHQPPVPPSRL
jgi:hypothetical protein